MRLKNASTKKVIEKLEHAQSGLNIVMSLIEKDNNCNEALRLTRLVRQEIKDGSDLLIRNYVVECSLGLKGDNSAYYVQEIVKSFRYLN